MPWTQVGQQGGAQKVVTIEPLVRSWLKRAYEVVPNESQLLTGGPTSLELPFIKHLLPWDCRLWGLSLTASSLNPQGLLLQFCFKMCLP